MYISLVYRLSADAAAFCWNAGPARSKTGMPAYL